MKIVKNNLMLLFLMGLFFNCMPETPSQRANTYAKETSKSTTTENSAKTIVESPVPVSLPIDKEELEAAVVLRSKVEIHEVQNIDGRKSYRNYCAGCHGFNGDVTLNGMIELKKSVYNEDEPLALIIFGRGIMTPYKNILSPAEMVAITKFVKEEF